MKFLDIWTLYTSTERKEKKTNITLNESVILKAAMQYQKRGYGHQGRKQPGPPATVSFLGELRLGNCIPLDCVDCHPGKGSTGGILGTGTPQVLLLSYKLSDMSMILLNNEWGKGRKRRTLGSIRNLALTSRRINDSLTEEVQLLKT